MKCPHCSTSYHENPSRTSVHYGSTFLGNILTTKCPACTRYCVNSDVAEETYRMIHPVGANRGPVAKEVPEPIAEDYIEACNVLPISAKASAALARRCLQNILRAQGYKAKDLSQEIDLLINEKDASKAIPSNLRDTVDGVRNFGNFSAHPITDVTSLQVIAVEPHEAEWCLEILEEMFDHFYVRPAVAKARKAALDDKLKAAGKPKSK